MSLPRISNETARAIFLDRHGLAETPQGADAASLLRQLGFVQIDSIATVERAHHMILWARRPSYRPAMLDKLHSKADVFEHWTHDASAIPIEYYPHWRLKFARDAEGMSARWERWQQHGFAEKLDEVLTHIEQHGSVCSSDLKDDTEGQKSTGWWDWHPSKTALEYLWRTGRLAVAKREAFRKVYDLPERVIPTELLRAEVSPEETIAWAANAAMDRLGFATPGEIAAFFAMITPREATDWCNDEADAGRLCAVEIEGADGSTRRAFARPESWHTPPEVCSRLRVLSPFDPALRDRKRAERLFGFHYRIEIFTPAPQRVYGYYVFPLLEGTHLVGRIDMKADRSADTLHITALWPERGVKFGKGRLAKLDAELTRLSRLAGVSRIAYANDWLCEPKNE